MSEYYFITCQSTGKVLEVENGNTSPGAKVSLGEKTGSDGQMWRDDKATGTIRNKLNDYCLDSQGEELMVNPYGTEGGIHHCKRESDQIVNSISPSAEGGKLRVNTDGIEGGIQNWEREIEQIASGISPSDKGEHASPKKSGGELMVKPDGIEGDEVVQASKKSDLECGPCYNPCYNPCRPVCYPYGGCGSRWNFHPCGPC